MGMIYGSCAAGKPWKWLCINRDGDNHVDIEWAILSDIILHPGCVSVVKLQGVGEGGSLPAKEGCPRLWGRATCHGGRKRRT